MIEVTRLSRCYFLLTTVNCWSTVVEEWLSVRVSMPLIPQSCSETALTEVSGHFPAAEMSDPLSMHFTPQSTLAIHGNGCWFLFPVSVVPLTS